jgi:hypothetical protein
VALAAVLLPLAGGSAIKSIEYLSSDPVELLPAVEVLRGRRKPGDKIVAFKPHLEYLPRLKLVTLPAPGDLPSFLHWLREESGARFLYVGPWETRIDGSLSPLAQGTAIPDWLTLLLHTDNPPASLFEVRARE